MLELKVKELKIGDIGLFKLDSTEELVGTVIGQDNNTYLLGKPRVITQSIMRDPTTGQDQMAIGLMPWFTGNQQAEEAPLEKIKVMSVIPAGEQMAGMYTEQTSPIVRVK